MYLGRMVKSHYHHSIAISVGSLGAFITKKDISGRTILFYTPGLLNTMIFKNLLIYLYYGKIAYDLLF